jgi:hypothetical protein
MKWPPCPGTTGRLRSDQVGVISGIRSFTMVSVAPLLAVTLVSTNEPPSW